MKRIVLVLILLVSTTWFAVNIYLGAGAAPEVFAHAQPHVDALFSKRVAGALFGDVLAAWQHAINCSMWPVLAALLLTIGILAMRQRTWWLMLAGLLSMACLSGIHMWSTQVVAQALLVRPPTQSATLVVESNSTTAGSLGDASHPAMPPYDDLQRAAFNALHRRSVTLFGAESLILLALVLASAVAVILDRDPLSPSAERPRR